jgi:hypothetical protein
MVEGSEKLNFPVFGLVTGFVSASTGNGKAQRLTARGSNTSLGICGKDAIEGSFMVEADCVKDCFESAEASENLRCSSVMGNRHQQEFASVNSLPSRWSLRPHGSEMRGAGDLGGSNQAFGLSSTLDV